MESTLIRDIKAYSGRKFFGDLVAGLTVAVVLIPQGMAYSMLAGLNPIYGLYAALVPCLVYPLFSSSRELSVGPVALMSIIILSGVQVFAEPGTNKYLDMVLMSGLLAGVIQIIFSGLKLGNLASFLSMPVMKGFISAAGVIIAISQIKYFLTLKVARTTSVVQMLYDDVGQLGSSNLYSLALGIGGIGIILLLKKVHKMIPGYLIAALAGTLALYFFGLYDKDVPIVGDIPPGLPSFYSGFFDFDYAVSLFPASLVIAIICFIGSYSIAKSIAANKDNYPISANKELVALGMAKIIGSFFLSMPSTGSFTRSAINEQAGATTGLSSIFSALFIGLTLMFFSPWFYYLPKPILAAIVITSVFSLIDFKEARRLYTFYKSDFWVFLATFLLTIFLGIVNGILSGVVLSLLSVISRSSNPHVATLGRLPHTNSFRNIERYHQAIEEDDKLILRYDQDLFFGNSEHFFNSVVDRLKGKHYKTVILHLGAIHNVDSTAMGKILDLIKYLDSEEIALKFTNLSGPIRDKFYQTGIYDRLGKSSFHLNVSSAVEDCNGGNENSDKSKEYSRQHNSDKKNLKDERNK